MKSLLVLVLLVASVAGMAGPVSAASVAVILSDRVDDYQEALRGFKETTRHPIVAEYNMGGDLDRGRKILTELETKVKPSLILAVGIWALQAIASHPTVDADEMIGQLAGPGCPTAGCRMRYWRERRD